jgi:guanylate kinase
MHKKSIIVTAPSGAGKTTLVKKLLAEYSQLEFSVSATTRSARENEVDGKDYYFISLEEFKAHIAADDFLEWEEVYGGSFYGTLKSEITKIHQADKIPVFDIDIMGAMSIKKKLCLDVLSIFIAPPTMEELEARLRNRKTETEEKIQTRLDKAYSELKFSNFFDKKIVNDEVERAYSEMKVIVKSYLGW